MSLMSLAFEMYVWSACGGDSELNANDAYIEGHWLIDKALVIFKEVIFNMHTN